MVKILWAVLIYEIGFLLSIYILIRVMVRAEDTSWVKRLDRWLLDPNRKW